MTVNYVLTARSVNIGIYPDDLPVVQVDFLLSEPGRGLAENVGKEVYKAIVDCSQDLQLVQVCQGFQRCFYCGEENPDGQKACLFCGKSA